MAEPADRPSPGRKPALKVVEQAEPGIGMGEEERIGRIVDGDGSAFAELVREFYPLAYGLAYRVLLDPEDAEEVVQDAFVKIHAALASFRGGSSLKTWILRIVLRLSLNRRRDRSRSSWYRLGLHRGSDDLFNPPDPRGFSANPEAECISAETRRVVLRLVDELPEGLRETLLLNSMEELSYEEIARVLGVPIGTVSSRIYSARRRLLPKLRRHGLV